MSPRATDHGPETIHALVAARARQAPERVAVRGEGAGLTYGELELSASRLARRLRRRGVGAGSLVALALPGSAQAVVAILAVLKCGAAYLPLDSASPPARLRQVLDDAGPVLAITDRGDAGTLGPPDRIVSLEALLAESSGEDGISPDDAATGRDLAYVIYTSGSTGRPKGVCVEHGSVLALVAGQMAAFGIGPESCVLQFASLAFDASVSELFTALCTGASLRVASREALTVGPALLAVLREGVTVATLPPSVLAVLPHEGLPLLATVVSAGEPCPDAVLARWSAGRRFVNAYGPTEATVCATVCTAGEGVSGAAIGRPLPGVSTYVLDPRGRPVPLGMRGELHIGGSGVARGYLDRPDLTAERFVPDPYAARAGARLYRTGDIARMRADGVLEFVGRRDRQLKIRGHRVEPLEIEQALLADDAVAGAAVVGQHAGTSDARLVAYVVLREPQGAASAPAALRRRLQNRLPDHLVPARIVPVPHMPLTANGKIDHDRLEALDRDSAGTPAVAPRTAVEEALAQIWCELLGLDSVGVTDDFFEIGGQSILAVRVIARIEEIWRCSIPIAELIEERTIQHLAAVVAGEEGARRRPSLVTRIRAHGSEPPLLLCHALGGSALCYLPLARHLPGTQPVWGLESPSLHHAVAAPASLAEAAARLADAVGGLHAGPLRVGGWSFGGVLAFELAREIERRGGTVERLFLFDPGPPRPAALASGDLIRMVGGFARRAGLSFADEDFEALPDADLLDALEARLSASMPSATAAALGRELRASAAHIVLRRGYRPQGPCLAPVSLFRATVPEAGSTPADAADPAAWGALSLGGITVVDIPATHGDFLTEPHVAAVARAMARPPSPLAGETP